jgi:multidrug efflux pump subunit AcrA (membrane-fusion protein)
LGELDSSTYAVVNGLKSGDQVIVSQIQKLRDGAPVVTSPAKLAGAASLPGVVEH